MKIVHVISSIDPAQGGPQSACVRLAAAQAALGHDVHIMSYGGIEVEKRAFKSAQDVPFVALVHWHLLDDPDRMEQILCVEGSRQLRQVLKGASFVHIHGVWEPILRKAANTARSNRIPYCVQPHGMLDAWSMKQKQLKKRIALLLGYRKMLDQGKILGDAQQRTNPGCLSHFVLRHQLSLYRTAYSWKSLLIFRRQVSFTSGFLLPVESVSFSSCPDFIPRRVWTFLGMLQADRRLTQTSILLSLARMAEPGKAFVSRSIGCVSPIGFI